LGLSRQNARRTIKRWMENEHLVLCRGPCNTQRQAGEMISDPNLTTRARLLSFNRAQAMVVIGLLAGHNTLRRHLCVMGLSNNPICRKCGIEEETSVHFCVRVSCWLHSDAHILAPSFWTLRALAKKLWGPFENFARGTGLL